MYTAHNSYELDCEEKDYTYSVQVQKSVHISSRLFKNEPSEVCSHLSEKGPKGRGFFAHDISENHTSKGKGKGKKEPGR